MIGPADIEDMLADHVASDEIQPQAGRTTALSLWDIAAATALAVTTAPFTWSTSLLLPWWWQHPDATGAYRQPG